MAKQKFKVAVIGIGRVGLPLSLVLAETGHLVYGIDLNQELIDLTMEGILRIKEDGGKEFLKRHVGKRFFPTTVYSIVAEVDFLILTLGTPVDSNMNPVYDQIDTSLKTLRPYLRKGQTLILRSTLAPQTTQYIKAWIETETKFKVGRDLFLAFAPERVAEGKSIEEITSIPQIIGGVDEKSNQKAAELFQTFNNDCILTDDTSAELAKIFTNMFRYINFAIANEFMIIAKNYDRDIFGIISMINRNYKRGGLAVPGLTAGPCLFKDGFFLVGDIPFTDLITTSWKINESIPLFLIKQIKTRMSLANKKVSLLGLAYKGDIDDIRESLSLKIRKALLRERAHLILQDPFVNRIDGEEIKKDVYASCENSDLIFVATNHSIYRTLNRKSLKNLAKKTALVCDVWNVFGKDKVIFPITDL